MKTLLALTFALAAALPAQNTATVTTPNDGSVSNLDRPFPGGVGRYQQWYAPADLVANLTQPMRIERAEFFAGSSNSSNATTLDMEVSMAHVSGGGFTGLFDGNYASAPVVVVPRQSIQLNAGTPGAVVLTLTFVNRFTWDGVHGVVLDVKIWGNSRNNQPFSYNLRGVVGSQNTARVYQANNPSATQGIYTAGYGLVTRFTARRGANVAFGTGCPGAGGFVPLHSLTQIGSPGIAWNQQLSRAASQQPAMWVIGDSNTVWASNPLPLDLGPLIGGGGCYLLTSVLGSAITTTVGGGPGGGTATLPIQLPPITSYVGITVYTQWIVADPGAVNGLLSVSQGMLSVIGPVGS